MSDYINNMPIPLIVMGILLIIIFLLLVSRLSKGSKKNTQDSKKTEQSKIKKEEKKLKEIPIKPKGQIDDPAMIRMNMEEQSTIPQIQNIPVEQTLSTPEIPTQSESKTETNEEKEEVELL